MALQSIKARFLLSFARLADFGPIPLSVLRLLVPPVRLLSAAVWQSVQQAAVADYGLLEEFVSTVTDLFPGLLLATRQRVQLVLGLRARLILDLCRSEPNPDPQLFESHLDRVQVLLRVWDNEVGAGHSGAESHSGFVDLVKNLVANPAQRKHFFQTVFPEEFGPQYDEALHTLMWTLLSRLEKFLPLHTFQQVSSMFGNASSVLEECMDSVSRCDDLKSLLLYQKHFSQLDPNDGCFDGTRIISALKLPSEERINTGEIKRARADVVLDHMLSCTSDSEKESLKTLQTSESMVCKSDGSCGENKAESLTNHEDSVGFPHQSQLEDASSRPRQCRVRLERLQTSLPARSRPLRQKRGLRMKKILLEEKRSLAEEAQPTRKTRKAKASSSALSEVSYVAPIDSCSDNDSWSYYSDDDSRSRTSSGGNSPSLSGSWSNYSGDEDPPFTGVQSASRGKMSVSGVLSGAPKKPRKALCFICMELVSRSLKAHVKSHFPEGDYACPRCDSRFQLFSSFQLHLKSICFEHIPPHLDEANDDDDLYHCDVCEEAFRYKMSLQRHRLTHHALYCAVCRKVLHDAAALVRHKVSHTPYNCNCCDATFDLFKPLLKHYENVHRVDRPYGCDWCPKKFCKLRLLIAHEWKHTGHLPFRCAQCGARFKTDCDLVCHDRVHTREKPYLCAECGKTFTQKTNLRRHLNLLHGELRNEKKYSCSECDKSFKEKGALKKHQQSKHLEELFRQQCPYCGKMVARSTMDRHKLIHTGERPFGCTVSQCDKRFRSSAEVRRHVLMSHSTERPFKCDICGKGFVQKCMLSAHAKVHSGEKPFVCQVCGKAFPKLYNMRRHKKLVHTFVKE